VSTCSVQPDPPSEGRNSATPGPAPRKKPRNKKTQTPTSPKVSSITDDNTFGLSLTRETDDPETSEGEESTGERTTVRSKIRKRDRSPSVHHDCYGRGSPAATVCLGNVTEPSASQKGSIRRRNEFHQQHVVYDDSYCIGILSQARKLSPLLVCAPPPQSSNKGAQSSKEICSNCGLKGHKKPQCHRLNKPGTNGSTASWVDSIAGKAWKEAGFDNFDKNAEIPKTLLGQSSSSSSAGASSTVPPSQRTPMSTCKHSFMSSVHSSTFSTPSDFFNCNSFITISDGPPAGRGGQSNRGRGRGRG
jgi:hypothetical protein